MPRPTFIGGTFHIDRIAERKNNQEKYYGFPLADAPYLVPFVDFRDENVDGQFRYFSAGLEIIGPGSFEKMLYTFDSGYDFKRSLSPHISKMGGRSLHLEILYRMVCSRLTS